MQQAVTQPSREQSPSAPCGAAQGRAWLRASTAERILQACVAAVLLGSLAVGLAMTPSPSGMGTHTGLGLPPCSMLVYTGHPCPTCGVTTSFVLAAHGRFREAFVNQPFGFALFVLAAAGFLLSVATIMTGRSWAEFVTVNRVLATVIILAVIAAVSWGYKWAQV